MVGCPRGVYVKFLVWVEKADAAAISDRFDVLLCSSISVHAKPVPEDLYLWLANRLSVRTTMIVIQIRGEKRSSVCGFQVELDRLFVCFENHLDELDHENNPVKSFNNR